MNVSASSLKYNIECLSLNGQQYSRYFTRARKTEHGTPLSFHAWKFLWKLGVNVTDDSKCWIVSFTARPVINDRGIMYQKSNSPSSWLSKTLSIWYSSRIRLNGTAIQGIHTLGHFSRLSRLSTSETTHIGTNLLSANLGCHCRRANQRTAIDTSTPAMMISFVDIICLSTAIRVCRSPWRVLGLSWHTGVVSQLTQNRAMTELMPMKCMSRAWRINSSSAAQYGNWLKAVSYTLSSACQHAYGILSCC